MTKISSAAGQNIRVGRRDPALKKIGRVVDAGWRYFWAQRGQTPPEVSRRLLMGSLQEALAPCRGDAATDRRRA